MRPAGVGSPSPEEKIRVSENHEHREFLVLSRGRWDESQSPAQIQAAIDAFYAWYDSLVKAGRVVSGSRLGRQARLVSQTSVTDGPFAESKEVIGGYWILIANDLDEAAALAGQNPCLACGLTFEVRPLERERASAYDVTSETPVRATK